jgi:hypothetical protein
VRVEMGMKEFCLAGLPTNFSHSTISTTLGVTLNANAQTFCYSYF